MRLIQYFFEGLAVALAAFFIPRKKVDLKEIIIIALTSAAVFAILDMITPVAGMSARQGAGFGIGLNQVGWIPKVGGEAPPNPSTLRIRLDSNETNRNLDEPNENTYEPNENTYEPNENTYEPNDKKVDLFTDLYYALLIDMARYQSNTRNVERSGELVINQSARNRSLLERAASLAELGRQLPPERPIVFTSEEKAELDAIISVVIPENMTVGDVVMELEEMIPTNQT